MDMHEFPSSVDGWSTVVQNGIVKALLWTMILSRSRAETLGHGILIFGRKIGHKTATKPLASESAVRFHCPHNIHAASGHRLHSLNKGGINDDDSDPM